MESEVAMLDLNELIRKQEQGNQLLASLTEDETVILQNYALLAARGILRARKDESATNLVINAFRNGVCLGLGLEARAGQIHERRANV
jgi:hypothetical protein